VNADCHEVRLLTERVYPALALVGFGLVVPIGTLLLVGHRPVLLDGHVHFYAVGIGALAAAAAALALTAAGVKRGDGRTVLIGTAFTVMAGLLSIHGIATPGIIIGDNGIISLTGALTLPVGGAVLALTAVPALRRPHGIRALLVFQVVAFVLIVALGTTGMVAPGLVPDVPSAGSPGALVALALGLVFYCLLLLRSLKTYLLTRRPADLVVVIGVCWMTAALPPALTMTYTQLGWWIGHFGELLGIMIVGAAVAVDLMRSTGSSRSLVGDLRASELVAQEEAYLGARVRSLTQRLHDKDESTEEHTRRVALRAVQVGEELGLAPSRLRALAIGGLLHDIGKLTVPERILKKPAALSDDEFAEIKRHPELGERLLGELGGFGETVRRLVRSHHERLDGKGYPDGIDADALNLDTRILAVCDVYDALVSPRVYRPAWGTAQAIDHLRDESGSAFDPRCVEALERVLASERPGEAAPRRSTAVRSPATAS
jgi:hypothetical protein